MEKTYSLKVNFDNGDHLFTRMNGTREEIISSYMGNIFNIGAGANDLIVTVVSVEFIE